jgi:D-alanyl-D-alanine dipeptidase
MGIFTEDWMKDMDGSLSMTDSKKISPAAIKYRKIMSKALEDAGFVNYPTEYWHWSYGDRYWAYVKKQPNAIYGQ